MRHSLLLLALILTFSPSLAAAQTWTGSVQDIRTNVPIPNARVCAGVVGRVDRACTTSNADGSFSVTYPENSGPGPDNLFYLYVESPAGSSYYHQKRAREVPGDATCLLVPTTVYFRGRVVNDDTGAPNSGVGVALRQPGRIDQSVESDGAGEFSFKPVTAYVNPRLQFNTFGVPEEDLPPSADGELINAVWGVSAPYGKGSDLYATVEPQTTASNKFTPELPFISSASPDAYTWVELRLPSLGTTIEDPSKYISSHIGPPMAQPDAGVPTLDGGRVDGRSATPPSKESAGGCSVWPMVAHPGPGGWVLGLLLLLLGSVLFGRVVRRSGPAGRTR